MFSNYIEKRDAQNISIVEVLPKVDEKTGIILNIIKYNPDTGEPYEETSHFFLEDLQSRKEGLQKQIDEIDALIADATEFKIIQPISETLETTVTKTTKG